MAFKVTAKQQKELAVLIDLARKAAEELRTVTDDFNEAIGNVRDFVEGMVSDWRDAMAERSEKWQESDAASEAESFVDEWDDYRGHLDPVELDLPEFDQPPSAE